MTLENAEFCLHDGARLHQCYGTIRQRRVNEMDLEEWCIRRVEAIEMHTLDEYNRAYILRFGWITLEGQGNSMVEREG